MLQFDRYIALHIKDIVISKLRMEFTIDRDTGSKPNTLMLDIYNMSANTANKMVKKRTPVALDIGYASNHAIAFTGHVREISRRREGADIITTIECGDGDTAYTHSPSNQVHAKGQTLNALVKTLVSRLTDVTIGDISSIPNRVVTRPFAAIGSAVTALNELAERFDFYWSIQNGVFVAVDVQGVVNNKVVLTPASGLIGLPSVEKDNEVSIKSLVNANISPHGLVIINGISKSLKLRHISISDNHEVATGTYRVDSMKHYGSNFGNAFYTEITKATRVINGRTVRTNRQRKLRNTA